MDPTPPTPPSPPPPPPKQEGGPPREPGLPPALPEVHDPYIALRFPNYRRYFTGNACALVGTQMTTYTVAYELYQRSNSSLVLGMVGLVQVIPIILLSLPAGQIVDRFNRKTLVLLGGAGQILLWLIIGFSSRFATHWFGGSDLPSGAAMASTQPGGTHFSPFADPHVSIMLSLLLLNGMFRAIMQPARQSLLPALVPSKHFANAVTWNSSLFEISNVVGPMTGGFAVAALLGWYPNTHDTWAFAAIYWLNAGLQFVQWINVSRIHLEYAPRPREKMTLQSMLAGFRFVYNNKVVLGALTLDMFAVLLGGATALLPVFAQEVLKVGPIGLAVLRAAPSMGALTMAMILTHRPPMEKAGRNLLWAVVGFGTSIIVFGMSSNFYLSMAALVCTGLFDNISVVVRHTLVQLLTPDDMRGRVNAVNTVFISSSNEFGEFYCGTAAHVARFYFGLGPVLGPMASVTFGGFGTILVAIIASLAWPELRKVGRLSHAK